MCEGRAIWEMSDPMNPKLSADPIMNQSEVKRALYGRGLWNVKIWIALGIVFIVLNLTDAPALRSPYWFSELVLYSLMIVGLWANSRHDLRKRMRIPRKLARERS